MFFNPVQLLDCMKTFNIKNLHVIISSCFQNALFYVISDDLIAARKIFSQEMQKEFHIAFPGNSQTPYPGIELIFVDHC